MAKNGLKLVFASTVSMLALAAACSGKDSSKGDGDEDKGGGGPSLTEGVDTDGDGVPDQTGTVTGVNGTGTITTLTAPQIETIRASACNGWSHEPENGPSKLELVIDISSSMSNAAPGTNKTKWEVTREALREAVPGVSGPGLSGNTAVGLMFYPGLQISKPPKTPGKSTDCLNTDASIAMDLLGGDDAKQRKAIDEALRTVPLGRSTPTLDAYKYALDNVVLGEAQSKFPGQAYMLLITDGMPTLAYGCYNASGELNYDKAFTPPIIDEVNRAYEKGVKTFVIGSPGSEEGKEWLSAAAQAGRTAPEGCSDKGPKYCHMDMTTAADFSAALRTGLSQVMAAIGSCKFKIPAESTEGGQKVDSGKISPIIYFDGGSKGAELVGRDSTASCEAEGFRVNSDTELELCPKTCARFEADPLARLELLFGCGTDEAIEMLQ